MMEQTTTQYTLGQQLEGKVEKVLPYGVFVRVGSGQRAYIRRRELSLTGDQDPKQIVQVGQLIDGVVCGLPCAGRMLELSHKASLPDPWDAFLRSAHEGDIVQGDVKAVHAYGIFVELIPGVNGFVSLSELGAWAGARPEQLFWRGDRVEAVITQLDPQNRKVRLSILRRLEQLGRVSEIIELLNQRAGHVSNEQEATAASSALALATENQALPTLVDPADRARIGRILIIEDSPEIYEPLLIWLRHRGYTADTACTKAAIHTQLGQASYGLLFVDIDLDMSNGLALIRPMSDQLAGTAIVVMSAPERLEESAREIEALGAVETFVKPLDLDEIAQLLTRMERGEVLPAWRATPGGSRSPAFHAFQIATAVRHGQGSDAERLQTCLAQLVKSVGADVGVIFYQDPVSQTISIRTQVGSTPFSEAAVYALKQSPVKDVIQEGDFIFENHVVGQAESRFRKLLDLFSFSACIGIPIEADGQVQHALFLFHCRAKSFKHYHLRDAMATATLCAALLERTLFNQQIWSLNQWLLGGQLAASFGHEVFNKLSGLEIQLYNLQTAYGVLCRQSDPQRDPSTNEADFQSVQQDVEHLVATAKDMRLVVENFQRLMRSEAEQALNVCDIVQSVLAQLRPLANKSGIKLKSECVPSLPLAMGNPIRIQQVLFNLLLNAIQHTTTKLQNRRIVQIIVTDTTSDLAPRIKLRVIDHGTGVHKQLWGKIFDLSFTTRPDGSGLGLFIAKSLVASMGGKLSVEQSVMLLGTTFLVELPALMSTEEGML